MGADKHQTDFGVHQTTQRHHPKRGRDLEDDGAVAVDDDHQERMDGCSRRIDSVGTIIYDICNKGGKVEKLTLNLL